MVGQHDRGTARVSVSEAVEQFMDLHIRPRYKRLNIAEVYCRAVKESLGKLVLERRASDRRVAHGR